MAISPRDEIQHVVTGQQINYEGIFNHKELFDIIDKFFRKKGYEKLVIGDAEKVFKTGRSINVRIRPFKAVKDNKLEIQVWINIQDMEDVIKEIDNVKVHMNKGKIHIILDAFVVYNLRGKWESRAEYFMIRSIFDKFLFAAATKDYEGMVQADLNDLKAELNAFLNLNKFLF